MRATANNLRNGNLEPMFLAPRQQQEAKPHVTMFHFRVFCPGDLQFDVQAATEEDAMRHVKRRHSSRVRKVEMLGEVKRVRQA